MRRGYVSKIILELKPPLSTTMNGRDELAKKLQKVIENFSRKKRVVSVTFEE
jgi:hypothetical protein